MKVRHIENSWVPRLLRVGAITLYPFILYAHKAGGTIRNHEMVHIRQIKSCGVCRFYLSYGVEYLSFRIRGDAHNVAYNRISYEKEAYKKQHLGEA